MGVNKNFVVKNGLEVNTNLILADTDINGVGIGTSNIYYKLHVNGGIGATDLHVTGIATFPYVNLSGTVAAGSSTGESGQYLVRSGAGVTWQNLPNLRTSTTTTATASQTTFVFDYTIGLVDVFVNGVKLSPSEFTATDGVNIVLNQPCFGGETVEFITYNSVNPGYAFTGIYGITVKEEGSIVGDSGQIASIDFVGAAVTAVGSGMGVTVYITDTGGGESYWESTAAGIHTLSNVGIATTNPRFALEVGPVGYADTALWVNGNARVTGILTVGTASIILDGDTNTITVPNLVVTNSTSGVTASGVGITIRSATVDLGVAEVIDFSGNLSADFSAGIATITTGSGEFYWTSVDVGIHTLSNVGIGTTNPTSALTVKGNTSLETLNVSGVSTFSGTSTFSDYIALGGGSAFIDYSSFNVVFTQPTGVDDSSDFGGFKFVTTNPGLPPTQETALTIHTAGDFWNRLVRVHRSLQVDNNITVNGTSTFAGITTVTGNTLFAKQLNVSGIITATSFSGSNTLKERTVVSGITTEIANNGIGNTNLTGYKSYALMKVGLSTEGWLRLYTDSASRTADVSRSVGEDPAPGSGVIAEVVTTGISTTQIISPFVMGGNLDDPADTTIYASITNLSGVTTSISVNLTLLQLEA